MSKQTPVKSVLYDYIHGLLCRSGFLFVIRLLISTPVFFYTRAHAREYARVRVGVYRTVKPKLVTAGLALAVLLVSLIAFNTFSQPKSTAAPADTLNFQARLQSGSGAIVPDGSYSIQFKLYYNAVGGSALWTETDTVSVVNGYVSVYLGANTPFPSNIAWDQSTYITMNVNSDGEMSPRLKLTAVPYAFQAKYANQLQASNGVNIATLGFTTPTATNTILLPDSSGTVCLNNSSSCGFAPGTTGSYIQNGTSLQTGNFNIQSSAGNLVTATIQAKSGQTANIFEIKDGSGNVVQSVDATGNLKVSPSSTATAALEVTSGGAAITGNTTINTTGSGTTSIGNASSTTTILGAANINNTGTASTIIGNPSNYLTNVNIYGPTGLNNGSSTANTAIGNANNTTSIAGTVNVNTSTSTNTSIGNVTGTLKLTSNAFNVSTAGVVSGVAGYTQPSGNFLQQGTGTFTTASGTNYLNGDVNVAIDKNLTMSGGGAFSTGTGAVGLNGDVTVATNKNLTVQGVGSLTSLGGALSVTGSSTLTGLLTLANGVSTASGTNLGITTGNNLGGTAGTITIDNGTSSSGTSQINIGTTNAGAITIGRTNVTTSVAGTLGVSNYTQSSGNFDMSASSGTFKTGTGAVSLNGNTTLKPASNSTTAFQIQNASSAALLTADTTNGQITVKNYSANESLTLGAELLSTWTNNGSWNNTTTNTYQHLTASSGGTSPYTQTLTNAWYPTSTSNYYQISFTVTGRTVGSFTITAGGLTSAAYSASDSWSIKPVSATASDNLVITPTATFDGTITFSVKQVTMTILTPTLKVQDSAGNAALEVRTGGLASLNNTFIGLNAGRYNNTGYSNVGVGGSALQTNLSGFANTAVGHQSLLANTAGNYNTATGYQSLYYNTIGTANTAFGYIGLNRNTTGIFNTAIGFASIFLNSSGGYNTALGGYSLYNSTTGSSNTVAGYSSMFNNSSGANNTAFGVNSLYSNTTSAASAAFGYYSLQSSTGAGNSSFGTSSGRSNTTGTNNVFLGYNAGYDAVNQKVDATNSIAIGYNTYTTASNQIILGNSSITQTLLQGAPAADATTSLIRLGSALSGANSSVNGGTYIGVNTPGSGAGSAADLINLQRNGTSAFSVGSGGTTLSSIGGSNVTVQSFGAGTSSAGGSVTIQGGAGGSTTGVGGALNLYGGAASGGNSNGGDVTINAGAKNGAGTDGVIKLGAANTSKIQAYITNVNTSFAMCASSNVADAGGNVSGAGLYDIGDCNAAPAADYAESYPVAQGITYGDIVVTGSRMVNTYDEANGAVDWSKVKGQVTELVKSSSAYQGNTIGIVSNNYGDFSSVGYNIKSEDNPMPVALNGRVVVNIAPDSEPIEAGDFITTSGTNAGKGAKATAAGNIIGKALEAWDPASGKTQVMVFVQNGYYPGPSTASLIQNGSNASLANLQVDGIASFNDINMSGTANFNELNVMTATVNGDLEVKGLLKVVNIEVNGHIITKGDTPTIAVEGNAGKDAVCSVSGNDTSGKVTVTTGSANWGSGAQCTVTFSKPYEANPNPVITPAYTLGATTDISNIKPYVDASTTTMTINFSAADNSPHTYVFNYFNVQ